MKDIKYTSAPHIILNDRKLHRYNTRFQRGYANAVKILLLQKSNRPAPRHQALAHHITLTMYSTHVLENYDHTRNYLPKKYLTSPQLYGNIFSNELGYLADRVG